MRFKNPGGNLVWLTPLMTLAGFYLAYHYYVERDWPGLAVFYAVLGLLSLLVWFDQKWVAIPLLIFCSLAVIGETAMLFWKGFSWRVVGRIVLAGYAVYDFWEWRRRPEEPPADDEWETARE